MGRTTAVIRILAGPAAGCAVAAALMVFGLHFDVWPLAAAGGLVSVAELANLLPGKNDRPSNDGRRLLEALRTRRSARPPHPLADVATRWLVLVTDARGMLGSSRSGGRLLRVLNALDRDPNDRNTEARALVRTAFSGWCWREAEQGDTAPIRDSALDARHRARLLGLSRADVEGWAAMTLARSADLAAASPAPDSLDVGFRHALAGNYTDGVPGQDAKFAFRSGSQHTT
jgi:hypothetical protein